VLRAQFRLAMYRVERDWYGLAEQIERESDRKSQARLKKELLDTMLESAELFKIKPYFLSDEFSVVDATIAPMLWRMRRYEIQFPPQAQAMAKYAATVLARPSMRASLSDVELEMGGSG
jgi:RNA polymerase-associated protein